MRLLLHNINIQTIHCYVHRIHIKDTVMEVLAVNDGDRGAVGFKMVGIGVDQSRVKS